MWKKEQEGVHRFENVLMSLRVALSCPGLQTNLEDSFLYIGSVWSLSGTEKFSGNVS